MIFNRSWLSPFQIYQVASVFVMHTWNKRPRDRENVSRKNKQTNKQNNLFYILNLFHLFFSLQYIGEDYLKWKTRVPSKSKNLSVEVPSESVALFGFRERIRGVMSSVVNFISFVKYE